MEHSRMLDLKTIRATVASENARMTPEQVASLIGELGNYRKKTMSRIQQDREKIRRILSNDRRKFPTWSRVATAGVFLMNNIHEKIELEALQHLQQRDTQRFMLFADACFGFSRIMTTPTNAEAFIAGKADDYFNAAVQTTAEHGLAPDVSENAQDYIRMQDSLRRNAVLLKSDNSGVSLIEEAVQGLKDGTYRTNFADFSIPQFVVAGGEFALQAYSAIYPLSK